MATSVIRLANALQTWPDRGPSLPNGSGGGLGSLLDTFVHSIVGALGWRAGQPPHTGEARPTSVPA